MSFLAWYNDWCKRALNWLEMIEDQRDWIADCKKRGWPTTDSEATLAKLIRGYTYAINRAERSLVR